MKIVAALSLSLAMAGAMAGSVSVQVIDKEGKPVSDSVIVLEGAAAPARATPVPQVTIRQYKMQFVPAVTLVPVGARVIFSNEDAWEHHIRGTSAGLTQLAADVANGFEYHLDAKGGKAMHSAEVVMNKPGVVLLGCYLHGSMRGHIFVTETPWAAKTDVQGKAVFENVPAGEIRIRAWHPDQIVDATAQRVIVGTGPTQVNVQLPIVPRRRTPLNERAPR